MIGDWPLPFGATIEHLYRDIAIIERYGHGCDSPVGAEGDEILNVFDVSKNFLVVEGLIIFKMYACGMC